MVLLEEAPDKIDAMLFLTSTMQRAIGSGANSTHHLDFVHT